MSDDPEAERYTYFAHQNHASSYKFLRSPNSSSVISGSAAAKSPSSMSRTMRRYLFAKASDAPGAPAPSNANTIFVFTIACSTGAPFSLAGVYLHFVTDRSAARSNASTPLESSIIGSVTSPVGEITKLSMTQPSMPELSAVAG